MVEINKTVLSPAEVPEVDLDFMNNTHVEEIKLVEAIGEMITAYQDIQMPSVSDKDQLTQHLKEWYAHTQAHFARENALMQETGFPAYSIHRQEHDQALANGEKIVLAWTENADIDGLDAYFFTTWPDWFVTHVNTMDTMTARFAVMNGYKPDAAPEQQYSERASTGTGG